MMLVCCIVLVISTALADTVTLEDATTAAQRFVEYRTALDSWDENTPTDIRLERIIEQDGMPIAYYFEVEPAGCALISGYRELPPVKMYSEQYRLEFDHAQSAGMMITQELQQKAATLARHNDLASMSAAGIDVSAVQECYQLWQVFTQPSLDSFMEEAASRELDEYVPGTYLVDAIWHEFTPYNAYCPVYDNEHAQVGCVALSSAQIMYYWQWPPAGQSSHQYLWNGEWISANFSDPYDWNNILPEYGQPWEHTVAELNAIAELCFEVGVAYETMYSVFGSGADPTDIPLVLPQYFFYQLGISEEWKINYPDDQAWFDVLCAELDLERPMMYIVENDLWGHAFVVDGYRVELNVNELHINYGGWENIFLGWYAIDSIPYSDWPDAERAYLNFQPDFDGYDPIPLSINVIPEEQQYLLVPQGGSFAYDVTLETNIDQPQFGWVWIEPILPSGQPYGPIQSLRMLFLPGMSLSISNIVQDVPLDAPLGYYQYWIHVGSTMGVPVSSDFFPFSVYAPEPDNVAGNHEWESHGLERLVAGSSSEPSGLQPQVCTVAPIYPNPFNGSTTITMSLAETAMVQIDVVNTLGQTVLQITKGVHSHGQHRFQFNAEALTSGVYFVTTSAAGQNVNVQKILLLQ